MARPRPKGLRGRNSERRGEWRQGLERKRCRRQGRKKRKGGNLPYIDCSRKMSMAYRVPQLAHELTTIIEEKGRIWGRTARGGAIANKAM